MSQFHSVINEFNRLTSLYGFKALRKLWYSDLVVLSKHLEGYFYCYIIARVIDTMELWKQLCGLVQLIDLMMG